MIKRCIEKGGENPDYNHIKPKSIKVMVQKMLCRGKKMTSETQRMGWQGVLINRFDMLN
jgi:hypothetical protein